MRLQRQLRAFAQNNSLTAPSDSEIATSVIIEKAVFLIDYEQEVYSYGDSLASESGQGFAGVFGVAIAVSVRSGALTRLDDSGGAPCGRWNCCAGHDSEFGGRGENSRCCQTLDGCAGCCASDGRNWSRTPAESTVSHCTRATVFAIVLAGLAATSCSCDCVFELYSRGRDGRRSLSLGLGLYMCRQIITAHSGEIGVISSPEQGATFWFTLPLSVES